MTLEISTLNTSNAETHTQQNLQLSATTNTRQHSQHSESTPEIELRDYQKAIISKTYGYIREGAKRILLVAIMGSGKTIIASWMMRDATTRKRRCVFLVALNVLLDQTVNTLRKLGVDCSVLQADRKGCVAKTFKGQSNPYNQLSLCRNSKNLIHEFYLT